MATELKHTVKPSGGDYTTLDAAIDHIVASHAGLVAADVYALVEIDGTWSSADTAAVTFSGLTMDATHYLSIYTTAAARHLGVLSSSYYQLSTANATAITYGAWGSASHIRIDGLQIMKSSSSASYQCCIDVANALPGSILWVSNCILKQAGNASYIEPGILIQDNDLTLYIWNSIIYGLSSNDNALNDPFCGYAGDWNIYSCTSSGGKYGCYINANTKTMTVKNTYSGNTITEDFYRGNGTLAKTNCASEDASADDTGTGETQSNCVAGAIAYTTATFTNVTAGSQNFHLVTGSGLIDVGASTSGEGAPLNFTTDIDGVTRSGTWDIGADEFVSAVVSAYNIVMNII
jgi:hypothetical protein